MAVDYEDWTDEEDDEASLDAALEWAGTQFRSKQVQEARDGDGDGLVFDNTSLERAVGPGDTVAVKDKPPERVPAGTPNPNIPAPPEVGAATYQSYARRMGRIHEMALAGNIEGILAEPTNGTSKTYWIKKTHEYKHRVLAVLEAMKAQGVKPAVPTMEGFPERFNKVRMSKATVRMSPETEAKFYEKLPNAKIAGINPATLVGAPDESYVNVQWDASTKRFNINVGGAVGINSMSRTLKFTEDGKPYIYNALLTTNQHDKYSELTNQWADARQSSGYRDATLESHCQDFACHFTQKLEDTGKAYEVKAKRSTDEPVFHTYVQAGGKYYDASGVYPTEKDLLANFQRSNDMEVNHDSWEDSEEGVDLSGYEKPNARYYYRVKPGIGRQVLANQAVAASRAGVKRLDVTAAGSKGGTMNGYYTWPRYGYDGKIEEQTYGAKRAAIEERFPEAKTFLDLMSTKEGRDYWKENGSTVSLSFDLTPGSRSMRVLGAYLSGKD